MLYKSDDNIRVLSIYRFITVEFAHFGPSNALSINEDLENKKLLIKLTERLNLSDQDVKRDNKNNGKFEFLYWETRLL